jgi:small subunit ribosomal protein S17
MNKVRQRKSRVGKVISDKMNKTRTVSVDRLVCHPLFKKYYRRTTKVHVHDEKNESQVGDQVEIVECSPISRTKRWMVKKVLRKAAA